MATLSYTPWNPDEPDTEVAAPTAAPAASGPQGGEYTYEPWSPDAAPAAAPAAPGQTRTPTAMEIHGGSTIEYQKARMDNPEIASIAESAYRGGMRNAADLNALLGAVFPDAGVFNLTEEDIVGAKKREAFLRETGQENQGIFVASTATGEQDIAPADTVLGTVADGALRSVSNMANSVTGFGALGADLVGADETADALLDKYLEDSIKIGVNYPSRTYKDVDSFGEAGLYAADILAETIPQLTGSMATGAIGQSVAKNVALRSVDNLIKDRVEKGVTREVAEQQVLAQVQRRAAQGMIAGTAGNTIIQESGATMGQTYMETGEKAPIMSLVAGAAAGSLDALAPMRALKQLGVGQEIAEKAQQKLLTRMAKEGSKQFLLEGGTESVQEFIQSLPAAVIKGESPFTEDMLDTMIEAFIRGGTGGTVVGGVSAVFQGSAATKVPEQAEKVGNSGKVFVNTTQKTTTRKGDVGLPADGVAGRIEALSDGWTNAPETVVVNNIEDLSKKMQEQIISDGAETAKGFYLPNSNTVIVLSDNLTSVDELDAMYFHEALGHAGLNQEFQTGLRTLLTDLYSTNQTLQQNVDRYMEETGETDLGVAVEEIMAEVSEDGPIYNSGIMNKIKDWIVKYTAGIDMPESLRKRMDIRQVRSIIAEGHARVMSGDYQDPSQNKESVRYSDEPWAHRSNGNDYTPAEQRWVDGLLTGQTDEQKRLWVEWSRAGDIGKKLSNQELPETATEEDYERQVEEGFRAEDRKYRAGVRYADATGDTELAFEQLKRIDNPTEAEQKRLDDMWLDYRANELGAANDDYFDSFEVDISTPEGQAKAEEVLGKGPSKDPQEVKKLDGSSMEDLDFRIGQLRIGRAKAEGVRYMRTWTVSPAKFTNPDNRFMSTGEGGQARGRGQYSGTTTQTRANYINNFKDANRRRSEADQQLRDIEHVEYFRGGTLGILGNGLLQRTGFLKKGEWYNIPHLVYEGTYGDLNEDGFLREEGVGRKALALLADEPLFTPVEREGLVEAFNKIENPGMNEYYKQPEHPRQAFGKQMEEVESQLRGDRWEQEDAIQEWKDKISDLKFGNFFESDWSPGYDLEDAMKQSFRMLRQARIELAKIKAKSAVVDAIHHLSFHRRSEADARGENLGDTSAYVYENEIPDEGYLMWDEPINLQPKEVYDALKPHLIAALNKRTENRLKVHERYDPATDELYRYDPGEYSVPRLASAEEIVSMDTQLEMMLSDIENLEAEIANDYDEFDETDEGMLEIREQDLESIQEAYDELEEIRENSKTYDQWAEKLTGGEAYAMMANHLFGDGDPWQDTDAGFYSTDEPHQKLNELLHTSGVTGVQARDGGSNWRPESLEELRILHEEEKAALYEEYDKYFTRIEEQVDKAEADIERGYNVATAEFLLDDALKQFQQFKDLYEKTKKDLESRYKMTYNYIVFDPVEMKVVNRYRLDDGRVPDVDDTTDLRQNSQYVDSVAKEVVDYAEEQDSIQGYLRYMRDRDRSPSSFTKEAYRGMAGNVNMNRLITKRGPGVYEWIQQAAEDAPELQAMTFEEIDQRARDMNLGLDEIREISRIDPAVSHAVGIALVAKAERLEYLANRINDPALGTDRDRENFAETMLELGVIYEKYSEMANDAGRLLAAFRIAKQTSGAAGIRFMREDVQGAVGMDIDKLAEQITKDKKNLGVTAKKAMKSHDVFVNALNLPRALMSSFDLSAPLRQGVVLIGRKEYWFSFLNMFRLIGSQQAFDGMMEEIMTRPSFAVMKKAGLSLTRADGYNLSLREERFMSDWAERIWIVGRGVKASERAFVGFLNKLRADTFENMLKEMANAGHDINANDGQIAKDLASFINSATGRGPLDLGFGEIQPDKAYGNDITYSTAMEKAAPMLNGLFFSPRLIASRASLLNPFYYGRLSGPVRKQAIKSMLGFGAVALTAMSLLVMAGFDVEDDMRSSDFGKPRDGTRRYDILGGFGQYITLGARLWTNETVTIAGEEKELGSIGAPDGFDVITGFLRNKASPVASFIVDAIDRENVIGEEFKLHTAITQRLVPLFLQDFGEAMKEDPSFMNALSIAPVLFGIGMSDFDAVPSDSKMMLANNPNSPMLLELDRLREAVGKQPISKPSGRANLEGDGLPARDLTEEEYDRYVEIAEEYYLEDLPAVINSPEYQNARDEDKLSLVREMANKARKDARKKLSEELFSGESSDGLMYEEWTPTND